MQLHSSNYTDIVTPAVDTFPTVCTQLRSTSPYPTAQINLHLYTLLNILTVELREIALRDPISGHGPED